MTFIDIATESGSSLTTEGGDVLILELVLVTTPTGGGIPTGSGEFQRLTPTGTLTAAFQSIGQTMFQFLQGMPAGVYVGDAGGGAAFEGASDGNNANAFFRLDPSGNFVAAARSLGPVH